MRALLDTDFLGGYRIRRRIDDLRSRQVLELKGNSRLMWGANEPGMVYHEWGVLEGLGTAPIKTERSYIWRFSGSDVTVLFEDGRPFHQFRAEGVGAGTDHLCGADLYRVRYDFLSWPIWEARWEVKGPRKDYVSVTRYERLD